MRVTVVPGGNVLGRIGRGRASHVIILITTGAFLVGLGFLPALALVRRPILATLIAPLTTAVLASALGTGIALLRCSMAFGFWGLVAVAAFAGVFVLRQPELWAQRDRSFVPLLFPVVGLVPFSTIRVAPLGYDSSVIWWSHARWFAAGGGVLADAVRNPVFAITHPDYPPFPAAPTGALWWLVGNDNLRYAQCVTAILTLDAVCALAYAIWTLSRRVLSAGVSAAVGASVVLAAYGVFTAAPGAAGTNGYVDALGAALIATAVVLLLASPQERGALHLGALMVACAALTKNESLVAALIVSGVAVWRYRPHRSCAVVLAVALAPALFWEFSSRLVLDAISDYQNGARVGSLLRLEPSTLGRLEPAARGVAEQVWLPTMVTLAVALAGWIVARRANERLRGDRRPWFWCAWCAIPVRDLARVRRQPVRLGDAPRVIRRSRHHHPQSAPAR